MSLQISKVEKKLKKKKSETKFELIQLFCDIGLLLWWNSHDYCNKIGERFKIGEKNDLNCNHLILGDIRV